MKQFRLSEEQLQDIQKRIGKARTHRMDGVDIDAINRHPKYGNRKTVVGGIRFDSAREADRWQELKLWEHSGEIKELERQVRFDLKVNKHLICAYIADFTYRKDGTLIVEDVKGVKTRDYIIKKKLMLAVHEIEVLET